ncbi:CHAT domain-containing tetratricopeptide repeat protein [Sphingomonas sp.]|jgi:CHAT domain-containing protein|uniref:CHAT domain-containing protein n=1 Tax=Sphingomonas sp. TaxID=28214 RepID=UPI002ED88FC7
MQNRGVFLGAVAACGLLIGLAAPSATAQQKAVKAPSAADEARLEQMRKAADDLDEGADPAAYRKAWEAVLAYGATLYPLGHPELAWLEGELVTADYLQGDIKGALARADRLAPLLEAGGAKYRDRRMELANAQVVIMMTLSEHDRARKLAAQVLEWRIASSGGQPNSNVAAAYSNYANAEFEFGNYDKAIELVRKANAEDRRHEKIPVNSAVRFANLPTYLLQTGRLEEAIEEARATQTTLEGFMPKGHPFLAANLNTLARILIALGRPGEAEAVARSAVDIAVARFGQSQQVVNYMATLAQTLTAQRKTDEAIGMAQSATEILTKDLGPEADRTLSARETHAGALAAAGQRNQAMTILRDVAAIRARKLPPFHRDRIGGGDRMAVLALKLGDVEAARAAQTEAQTLRRSTFPPEDIATIVGEARLGAIEARSGDKTGGLTRALAATKLLDARLRQLSAVGTRRSGREIEIRSGYGWALDAALNAGDQRAAFMLAQRMLESSAGRAVQEAAARSAAGDPQIAALIRDRQDAAMELEILLDRQLRMAGRGADTATIEAVAAERRMASARLEQRTAALKARAPQLIATEDSAPLTLEAVQAALGTDEALLVTSVGDSITGLFAVTREGVAMAASPAGAQEIGMLVHRLRAGLTPEAQAAGTSFDFDASSQLHAMLLPQSIRTAISRKPRLLVAANASLAALPFATLAPPQAKPSMRSARWLIRDHALVTLPSIASIAAARSSGGGQKVRSFFAVGAPQLSAPGSANAFRSANMAKKVRELPALPATEPELRAFGRALAAPEQFILTGSGATESAIRSADLGRADVLAFATHGLTAGDLDGLDEPALVMTPEGSDDGLLTVSEIMRLRTTADWIILSACNTAAGGSPDDSGLAGLARAFLYAGGRNLLASHWAVRDDAAAYLSVETVRGYGRGIDPAQALRQAILRMIDKRPFSDAEHPINWAPFVFVGR